MGSLGGGDDDVERWGGERLTKARGQLFSFILWYRWYSIKEKGRGKNEKVGVVDTGEIAKSNSTPSLLLYR